MFLFFIILISYIYCTIEECESTKDQKYCNNIKIEFDDFYCYKANLLDNKNTKCLAFPKEKEKQKLYGNLINGLFKDLFSFFGKEINDSTEEALIAKKTIEKMLFKSKKEFFDINEVIETEQGTLSSKDIDIISKENTCGYYLFGKYMNENLFENIKDRETCFKISKFDEIKDIIDCGYAVMKLFINHEEYEFRTCYYIPTDKLPKSFIPIYMSLIKENLESQDGVLNILYYHVIGNDDEIFEEIIKSSDIDYIVEVENEFGRKVKYSKNKNNFEVISEGTEKSETDDEYVEVFEEL